MTKKGLVLLREVSASSAVLLALLVSREAFAQANYVAQGDTPQWLKDRKYNEGIGIRSGDLEIHPGVAGEVGYDSNWFLRSDSNGGFVNSGPNSPPIPALEFRITPSLYLSTLGPQRREGDVVAEPPSVRFRTGVNATYREFIGLSSSPVASAPSNDISRQRNVSGAADARLEIAPERPFGAALFANYGRTIQPNASTGDPNLSFNRDDVSAGGEFVTQPGSGTLDWHFGAQFHDTIFEDSAGSAYDNTTSEAYTRGRWKFRPRTALVYDATFRFINYANAGSAFTQGLVSSTPVRARFGINGLVTDRFAFLGIVGWGASFYDTKLATQPQYDSVIGQAELKWYLSANPGIQAPSEVGLALSSIAVGYTRDFQNSYLGNYYGSDRGYLRFNYFFAGRALVTLEGGAGAIEYPNMYWPGGAERHPSFTDLRVDATLFGEYRLSDSFGINTTVRYTANFSNAQVQDVDPAGGAPVPAGNGGYYDMAWNRVEAFLGVRYFL
jgi:hypothetical protein